MATHFSEAAVKFLRGLARHNDREWFEARRAVYEAELKAPMLAAIAEVNDAMLGFAPEHVRPPQKIMMRIYRDIRFSSDKSPYKTHVSAWWARHGLEKTSGAGFYFHLSADELRIAAGVYMPDKEHLLGIRRMLLDRHVEFRSIVASARMTALMQPSEGHTLSRGPKGFPTGHPATDLVMQSQWGVSSKLTPDVAQGSTLVSEIVKRFKLAAPLVALLNSPLENRPQKPLF